MARRINVAQEAQLKALNAIVKFPHMAGATDTVVRAELYDKTNGRQWCHAFGADEPSALAAVLEAAKQANRPATNVNEVFSALDAERKKNEDLQKKLEALQASNGKRVSSETPPPADEKVALRNLLTTAGVTEGWDGRSSVETLRKLAEENELLAAT